MKIRFAILVVVATILASVISTHDPVVANPAPYKLCFDERLLGAWRRLDDPIDQQLVFYPNGDYGWITYDAHGWLITAGDETTCPQRDPNQKSTFGFGVEPPYTTDRDLGGLENVRFTRDGTLATFDNLPGNTDRDPTHHRAFPPVRYRHIGGASTDRLERTCN